MLVTIYFNLDEDGFVNGYSTTECESDHKINVVEGHEVLNNPYIFKLENGSLVKGENQQEHLERESERQENKLTREQLNSIAIAELAEAIARGRD